MKDSVVTITGIKAENVYHSADTNKDWKIDQNELDAVISLYNYRSGTARTERSIILFLQLPTFRTMELVAVSHIFHTIQVRVLRE